MSEQTIRKYLAGLKGKKWLLLLLAAGLLLLVIGGQMPASTKTDPEPEETLSDTERYRLELEEELTALCRQVAGVGDATVSVTLATGWQYTYSGSRLLSETPPRVLGIAVVCTGGGNAAVRAELTALLSSVTAVGTNRIYVSAKK